MQMSVRCWRSMLMRGLQVNSAGRARRGTKAARLHTPKRPKVSLTQRQHTAFAWRIRRCTVRTGGVHRKDKNMLIKIGRFDITECWDGVFYKALSDYPNISDWEMQTVADFIRYEKQNGRQCKIEAEKQIIKAIEKFRRNGDKVRIAPPEIIRECTACPKYKGCMTDLVCHTSPVENAVKILNCGSLLSPVLARGMTARELKAESRNAANDPEDYFEHIMFAWGNCQAGDRLVMERKLGAGAFSQR